MPIPVKQFLLIESFHNENNILRTHNIFGNTELFLKQEGSKTPVWQKSSNFTSLLGISFRKSGGPEKYGPDLKKYTELKSWKTIS